jgi:hypothetical protein
MMSAPDSTRTGTVAGAPESRYAIPPEVGGGQSHSPPMTPIEAREMIVAPRVCIAQPRCHALRGSPRCCSPAAPPTALDLARAACVTGDCARDAGALDSLIESDLAVGEAAYGYRPSEDAGDDAVREVAR